MIKKDVSMTEREIYKKTKVLHSPRKGTVNENRKVKFSEKGQENACFFFFFFESGKSDICGKSTWQIIFIFYPTY